MVTFNGIHHTKSRHEPYKIRFNLNTLQKALVCTNLTEQLIVRIKTNSIIFFFVFVFYCDFLANSKRFNI